MIVPLHPDDLEGELTLNPVLGVYDADDTFSTVLSGAPGIEGTFAAVGTGSTMLTLSGGDPSLENLNNLAVSFSVHPERSLGRARHGVHGALGRGAFRLDAHRPRTGNGLDAHPLVLKRSDLRPPRV